MREKTPNIQIDAVIPWVNGNDRSWQQNLNRHLNIKIDFNEKKESVRFNSIGEIEIAIKSIIKYAPFFRNIFLVTDNQKPDSFEDLKKLSNLAGINLEIIDHKIIFHGFEEFLPCFNSTSIITLLHRIPNLSEHYVIFNDDTFIMRTTAVEDFFINGLPVLRGSWKKYYEDQKIRTLYYRFFNFIGIENKKKGKTLKKGMQAAAKLAKDEKKLYLRRYHTPISIRKSTLENFFSKNEETLKNNIKYKFRDLNNQFITETLANHLEIKNKTYHYKKNTQLTYFRSYKKDLFVRLKLFWFTKNTEKIFITFQSLELANDKTLKYILDWINMRMK